MREFLFANKQTKKVANGGDLLEIRAFIKKSRLELYFARQKI